MTIHRFIPRSRAILAHPQGRSLLFVKYDLVATLDAERRLLEAKIAEHGMEDVQGFDPDEFAHYIEQEFMADPPQLLREEFSFDYKPVRVDVRNDDRYDALGGSEPVLVEGVEVTCHLPFSGQPELFECHSDTLFVGAHPSEGLIKESEILVFYRVPERDTERIKQQFRENLQSIERDLGAVLRKVLEWNQQLPVLVRDAIEKRRAGISRLTSTLGIPLRKRPEAESNSPLRGKEQRKVLSPPSHTEPYLGFAHYEEILTTIQNVGKTFERAPSAFAHMGEEDLRYQFLVPLSASYEDGTGAEVFNYNGKTDILIRHKGHTVFIAECKIWKGKSSLIGAIDQLLGYTTWRDTKVALLIFNKNRDFSSVLAQIPAVVKEHPAFVAEQDYEFESGFRFVLSHPDDQERQITMTIIAFEVPTAPTAQG